MRILPKLRKAGELLKHDSTGLSFFKYSCRWLSFRTRRVIERLRAPRPKHFVTPSPDKIAVAVKATGGIGDYVIIARVLRDIGNLSDSIRFHVFCPTVKNGKWVFGSVASVEKVYNEVAFQDARPQYDCAMYLNQFVHFDEEYVNWDKIKRLAPSFAAALARCGKSRKQWEGFIEVHPLRDGEFADKVVARGLNRYTFIYSELGMATGALEMDFACDEGVADRLAGRFKRWITLNTGFDSHIVISARRATKSYPAEHWEYFVKEFTRRYPDVAVIQIGAKTSATVRGVTENLIGKTSLSEAVGVLRRALFHVDGEEGLVHLAASLGKKSIVLFGPTSVEYFAYAQNSNLSSGVCGNCWWSTERWMDCCPRGYEVSRCMHELRPDLLLEAACAEMARQGQIFQTA